MLVPQENSWIIHDGIVRTVQGDGLMVWIQLRLRLRSRGVISIKLKDLFIVVVFVGNDFVRHDCFVAFFCRLCALRSSYKLSERHFQEIARTTLRGGTRCVTIPGRFEISVENHQRSYRGETPVVFLLFRP